MVLLITDQETFHITNVAIDKRAAITYASLLIPNDVRFVICMGLI